MDAQTLRAAAPVARWIALVLFSAQASVVAAAAYRTANFVVVSAPTPQLAKEIGDTAERCRRELAIEWLGRELPNWSQPCPIAARVSPQLPAGGETSFVFDGGRVFGWDMHVQGTRERVLDSVIPHEVTHTIFASHFRRPLPRWADEGACTTVEHHSEIAKQEAVLIEALMTRRGIPFSTMFAMKEYPQDVLPLYAQGHSLTRYLIAQRGKQEFLAFIAEGMQSEHWPRAIEEHYGYGSMLALQNDWLGWVRNGCPPVKPQSDVLLASAESADPASAQLASTTQPIVRGQTPEPAPQPASPPPSDDGFAPARTALVHDPWLSGAAPYQDAAGETAQQEAPVTGDQLFGSAGGGVNWPATNAGPETASAAHAPGVYEAIRQGDTVYRYR